MKLGSATGSHLFYAEFHYANLHRGNAFGFTIPDYLLVDSLMHTDTTFCHKSLTLLGIFNSLYIKIICVYLFMSLFWIKKNTHAMREIELVILFSYVTK